MNFLRTILSRACLPVSLLAIAGAPLQGQQASLRVGQEPSGEIRIAWPVALSGYVLESAPSLGTPPPPVVGRRPDTGG